MHKTLPVISFIVHKISKNPSLTILSFSKTGSRYNIPILPMKIMNSQRKIWKESYIILDWTTRRCTRRDGTNSGYWKASDGGHVSFRKTRWVHCDIIGNNNKIYIVNCLYAQLLLCTYYNYYYYYSFWVDHILVASKFHKNLQKRFKSKGRKDHSFWKMCLHILVHCCELWAVCV